MWGFRRPQNDFASEIEAHLQLEIDRRMAEGASEAEARAAARRAFGNVTAAQERFHEACTFLWLENVRRDVRYAVRMLMKSPGLTAIAIATMALGIGASTSIFTVINAVLLRPLAFAEPDRLLMCLQRHAETGPEVVTLPDYLEWRDHTSSFQMMAATWDQSFNLTEVDEPERLAGASVTANLIPVLGVAPHLGRSFASDDERDVVVLSYNLWRRRFQGDKGVAGRRVVLNGKPHTVIGVMPAGFAFPAKAELWVPLVPEPGMNRGYHNLQVVGRLKPDASIEQARAELTVIAERAAREHPGFNKNWGVAVSTLHDFMAGPNRRSLLILAGAVSCLLLLACANVAGLLMSRSATRRHEMSIRAALGGSRRQIVQQLLTESLQLSTLGGAIGLAVADFSIQPLLSLTSLPRADEVSVDVFVLGFTLVASMVTGIVFGLAPALAASRSGLRNDLTTRGGTAARIGPVMGAVQIAMAVVLLAGAGLMMRSFQKLYAVDTGFRADRLLTVQFFVPRPTYTHERRIQLYREIMDRMAEVPGVDTAAVASSFPFSGVDSNVIFAMPGRQPVAGESLTADFRAATPGYFGTIGIPIMDGRDFAPSDTTESQFVAVVNRAAADRFFGGRSPLGQFVRLLGPKPRMIVGVVPNIRHRGLDSLPQPEIYIPHTQFSTAGMFLAIRTRTGNPLALAGAVRAALRRADPGLPIARLQSGQQLLDATLSARRFSLVLLTVFAAAALTLSLIGIYGMLAFNVSQRTKEIGIRMALGASTSEVVRSTVRNGMAPVAIGLIAGLAGAMGVTRVLKSMLFEVQPHDPMTLACVVVLLLLAATAACLLPARSAARVDPVIALRNNEA